MKTVDRRPWAVFIVLMVLAPMGVMGQTIATDNAGNYSTDWTGDQGTGFGEWAFQTQQDGGFAGRFLSTTTRTISTGTKSWGMYANGGGTRPISAAFRGFDAPLAVGQTISVDIQNGEVENGGKLGFHLRTNNVTDQIANISAWSRFEFSFTGGESHYEVFDAGSDVSTGLGWSNGGIRVAFTLVTANTYDLKVTRLSDNVEFTLSGRTLGGVTDNALNSIAFFVDDVQKGSAGDVFFNNLTITQPEVIDPPAAIVLTSPSNSATGVSLRPTFTWEADAEADTYQLQVSTSSDFSTTVVNTTGITGTSQAIGTNLRMAVNYFWRVRGVNGGGNGDWSETRTFNSQWSTMTLHGNGGGGFGNVVGDAILTITHDDTHLYFEIQKGAGNWNDVLTLYLDSKSGGFTTTSTLTDEADEHRKAASGYLSDITFPTGFSADYAVTLDTDFSGLWVLSTGTFANPTSLSSAVPANTTEIHTFRIAKSAMDFTTENTFSVIGTYGNANTGFRSNESFSIGLVSTDPGNEDVTLRSFHNYPAGTITADVWFFGSAGWRFLANPFTGLTLNDYISPLWTQGFPGSDSPNVGSSNVFHMNSSGAYVSVGNQSDAMTRGQGYVVGVFQDDNYNAEGAGSFPKTVTVTGTPNYNLVNPTLNGNNQFSLVGNPFPFAIDFDNLTRENVSNIAYVYDYVDVEPTTPDVDPGTVGIYRAWNGSAGSLTGGRIASFQSFLVHSSAEGASLGMELADRASPTLYFGKEASSHSFEIVLKGNGMYSSAWVDISGNASLGIDSKDAFKLRTFERDQASVFTLAGDVALDIQHLPVGDVVELPLGIESTKPGWMRLERGTWDIPAEWGVYVRDTQTGVVRELKDGIAIDVEPTVVTRKASASGQIERVTSTAPRYTIIIDPLSSTSTENGKQTTENFLLEQNYPNPFNPSTVIGFQLSVVGKAKLSVYDVLGREVAVLVNETLPAGSHSVTFDATSLTSGVYVYKLEAGGELMTRRMTLLK